MHDDTKRAKLIAELHAGMRLKSAGKTLIFVPTIKLGEEVREILKEHEIEAKFFYGQLPPMERELIIQELYKDTYDEGDANSGCVICTNAFGMGMDIPDVRLLPKSPRQSPL